MLQPAVMAPVPEYTARVARAAFPDSTLVMRIRDELGEIHQDTMFVEMYSPLGQPALAPWRLALVTVLQLVENLSDRQAAEAVRSQIDWQYALGLERTDPGFDFSVLSEFRTRLILGGLEDQLLTALVERCQARGLVKARGRQRTDSTPVLAAVRVLISRLGMVGETLRAALDSVARVAPDWLAGQVEAAWFDRYARPIEDDRLPQGQAARRVYSETIGRDGHRLLAAVWAPGAPPEVRVLPAEQFHGEDAQVRWRDGADLPPATLALTSPDHGGARYGTKRGTTWIGCKVHLTETCDDEAPHLIVQVTPDRAGHPGAGAGSRCRSRRADPDGAGGAGVGAGAAPAGRRLCRCRVAGAQPRGAYDVSVFTLDWTQQRATCPQGQVSRYWNTGADSWGNPAVFIQFAAETCAGCPARARCTRATRNRRSLTVRTQAEREALQQARHDQETTAWWARYAKRAGVEGTLSQAIRAFGLRQCRYLGHAKARLQHLAIAAALNFARLDAWLRGEPRAETRRSAFAKLQPMAV